MKNNYNFENEKYADVRQLLQNLPSIKAPENFETELKRKINLLPSVQEKKPVFNFYFRRAFIPAAAFALTSIILFFIVNNNNKGEEYFNTFIVNPPLITDKNGLSHLNSPFNVSSNDVIIKNGPGRQNVPPAVSTNTINNVTSSAYRNRIREFLAENQGNNVDKSLSALPGNSSNSNSRSSTVNFGGFNIIQEDDKTMDGLRARMDSIKRWMRESDRR